jgi:hypothetical protein
MKCTRTLLILGPLLICFAACKKSSSPGPATSTKPFITIHFNSQDYTFDSLLSGFLDTAQASQGVYSLRASGTDSKTGSTLDIDLNSFDGKNFTGVFVNQDYTTSQKRYIFYTDLDTYGGSGHQGYLMGGLNTSQITITGFTDSTAQGTFNMIMNPYVFGNDPDTTVNLPMTGKFSVNYKQDYQ